MRRPRVLYVGAAATIAAAALIVLALELNGGGTPAKQAATPPTERAAPKHKTASKHAPKTTEKRRVVHRQAVLNHKLKKAQVHRRTAKAKPRRAARKPIGHRQGGMWIPWRPDGTSLVAGARSRHLVVYGKPAAKRPMLVLRNPDPIGTPRVVLVHSQQQQWVRVYLPVRPNGITGWVQARAVRVLRNPYRIVVSLGAHRLYLYRGTKVVLTAATVIGRPSLPTPRGMYYVVDLLKPPDPNGAYGPYTFDLSAHSDVLKTFEGGDGHVAIHGTNEPSLLGQSASHGCIRVSNAVIRKLAHVLPLGTPVLIRG
jgi:lipoprotein-anchoring transpeptidase ErfK/SrfK